MKRLGKTMIKYNIILVCLVLIVLSSCQDGRWYPSADVVVESYYKFTDEGDVRQTILVFSIRNTSKTSIVSSAITFKLETDQREYLQTVISDVRIIPNGMIAISTVVPFLDNTENLIDVVVVNAFFD